MNEKIKLSEVLKQMKMLDSSRNPVPFSISVRTYNHQNKYGGRLVHYKYSTLMQPPKEKGAVRLSQQIDFKDPNHWKNRTRNIKTPEGIKKIHIMFITEFNGKAVIV